MHKLRKEQSKPIADIMMKIKALIRVKSKRFVKSLIFCFQKYLFSACLNEIKSYLLSNSRLKIGPFGFHLSEKLNIR